MFSVAGRRTALHALRCTAACGGTGMTATATVTAAGVVGRGGMMRAMAAAASSAAKKGGRSSSSSAAAATATGGGDGASLRKAFQKSVKKDKDAAASPSTASSSSSTSSTASSKGSKTASTEKEANKSATSATATGSNDAAAAPAAASASAAAAAVQQPAVQQPAVQQQHHTMHHFHEFAPKICVVGVGGAGGNAVNNMIARGLSGVDFLVCNTDAQHLSTALTDNRLQLGADVTEGLGCGANPEMGRVAAEESVHEIMERIGDAHMVFITAGMGGGTGTGAAPVVAEACMKAGVLTVAVVTRPFAFEGRFRTHLADAGIGILESCTDSLIVVPNQNLMQMAQTQTTLMDAFAIADDVLLAGVKSVTDLMTMPGLINLDFADVQAIMQGMGYAVMGTGQAGGEDRALKAAEDSLRNPLLGSVSVKTAKGMLINITGGNDVTLFEVDAATQRIISELSDDNANIIFGSAFDSSMEGDIRVSIVATGIEEVNPDNV